MNPRLLFCVALLVAAPVVAQQPEGFHELKTGDALIRPPVTHSDEALDDVESILIELKK